MESLTKRKFHPNCGHNDMDIDSYYTRDKVFGSFSEDGRSYTVTERDTPRPWVQNLCNDLVRCAFSNTGKGFLYHINGTFLTKEYEKNGDYMPRNVNGQRQLWVGGAEFFTESTDFTCTVRPGQVKYHGFCGKWEVTAVLFVPHEAPCECWAVTIQNNAEKALRVELQAAQELCTEETHAAPQAQENTLRCEVSSNLRGYTENTLNIFGANDVQDMSSQWKEEISEALWPTKEGDTDTHYFFVEKLATSLMVAPGACVTWQVVSGACQTAEQENQVLAFMDRQTVEDELIALEEMWDGIVHENHCTLPDKNMERFLNVWLKNQIYVTTRYDRGGWLYGYRDVLQDSWGNLLVEADKTREKLLFCLSCMHPDGRCPRQMDRFGSAHDLRDFSDSPLWAPITLNAYIRETGDVSILDVVIPYLDSDEQGTVEEHLFRALDYMYHARGRNGLIRMRGGDWADGLSGINKYGEDATSVWVTIAAHYAQTQMAEIYEVICDAEKAALMHQRNDEYKEVVNRVGWNGEWVTYGFFEDGEPIGSPENREGRIWLNPQTWGLFSGVIDDPKRIHKVRRAVSRYLDTVYGAMVMYPPYVFYSERCGRVQRQRPGTFLNAAVYNHAASFKVFSDVACGEYEEAVDTLLRCLPNHVDNPDLRRTSEPWAVGNVYYGIDHPRAGLNLFSWYTACPSWLIHGGYEQILGIRAGFDGLEITPHVPEDWEGYTVTKHYRGTLYDIVLEKSAEKGIWVDGVKIEGHSIKSDKENSEVLVRY